ncbi:HlyD family secretion protein [Cobetia crustatorum]|uniref:HlyD family efflux transporter periplasmic adaptor subunit n=1 Tax=Cobetia crustatorum TaxID=553385 RepID=A0A558HNN9_9GAMM|nr:HlyD family efflux transporter periplasmic adaptor subunit [Cobetia crustatorum]TVU70681.1 hypothetical protein FQP86_08685 [Cobetia crustatorum]
MDIRFDPEKSRHPDQQNGLKVPYAKVRRGGGRWRWFGLMALILVPVIAFSWYALRDRVLLVAPAVLTHSPLVITSPRDARVVAVPQGAGEKVSKGKSLFLLEDSALIADQKVLTEILATLPAKGAQEQSESLIDTAQRRVANAQSSLTFQSSLADKFDAFRRQGEVPLTDLASIHVSRASAQDQLSQSQENLLIQQREKLRAELTGPVVQRRQNLTRQLAQLEATIAELNIDAPQQGLLAKTYVQAGQRVSAGESLGVLVPANAPELHAYFSPKYVGKVAVGRIAEAHFSDGHSVLARIVAPPELTQKLPSQLAGPFDGNQAMLEVRLTPLEEIDLQHDVEGLPLEIRLRSPSALWGSWGDDASMDEASVRR